MPQPSSPLRRRLTRVSPASARAACDRGIRATDPTAAPRVSAARPRHGREHEGDGRPTRPHAAPRDRPRPTRVHSCTRLATVTRIDPATTRVGGRRDEPPPCREPRPRDTHHRLAATDRAERRPPARHRASPQPDRSIETITGVPHFNPGTLQSTPPHLPRQRHRKFVPSNDALPRRTVPTEPVNRRFEPPILALACPCERSVRDSMGFK